MFNYSCLHFLPPLHSTAAKPTSLPRGFVHVSFWKYFFHLFLERGERRGKERERNMDVKWNIHQLSLSCPQLGTGLQPRHTPDQELNGESNRLPLGLWARLNILLTVQFSSDCYRFKEIKIKILAVYVDANSWLENLYEKGKELKIGKTILKKTNLEDSHCLISRLPIKLQQLIQYGIGESINTKST